jgi:capsular polysaccharide biosynthesis protein
LNLTEYLRILLRRGWIMLLVALIAGGTAYLLSRQQDPVYRATQNVVIQPSRADLGLAEASVRLLNSLVVIIDTEQTAQEIIEDLDLDMTSGQLKSMATIAADQFRLVIRIDIESESSEEAFEIARAWGLALKEYRDQQNAEARREDRVFAVPADLPSVSQVAPRPLVNGIAGGILGLLVGGVVVFVLEYLESSAIRRREDLETSLQMDVIATIPGFDPS